MNPPLVKTVQLRLRVTAAAERQVRAGHPWVYSDSVRELNRAGTAGELAVVYDRSDKFLAVGLFDPDSPLRVRILHAGKPRSIDAAFWRTRLADAQQRRAGRFDPDTTGYRLINGESDGWPGLVLDRYDTTLVLKIYTAAWLNWLDAIETLVHECWPGHEIVFRCSRNIEPAARASGTRFHKSFDSDSATAAPVIFQETGLRFEAEVWRGQKTGFFLDQRENRRQVESFARGRAVLNAFSFSGGFSLYAARGGAASVTDLDISKHALASAGRNFALNADQPSIAACRREGIQTDAFAWLAGNPGRQFDLVVLDPPSLARREAERATAIGAYGQLVSTGLTHLSNRGILVACSCSAHVSAGEFFNAVRQAAQATRRRFVELQTTGHAADHPATFPEAEYLKAIYLQF